MKSQHFYAIFLIAVALNCTNAFIIERRLSKDDKAVEFYEGVNARVKELLDENDIENKSEPTSENQKIFILETKGDARIEIQRASNEIEITMKNKYEELKVTSENMDYSKQKDMIDNQFLVPFIPYDLIF